MILNYQKIELLEQVVFERVLFRPPLKATETMENEACLIYAMNGNSKMYSQDELEHLSTGESILLKCGSFINQWQPAQTSQNFEAIAIHFYPNVLQMVFDNHIPDYLKNPVNPNQLLFQKIKSNAILQSYMNSLLMYFENPVLFTTDTIKLKLRELITLLYNLDLGGIRKILSDLFNPQQIDFKTVIAQHLFEPLNLEDYAFLLHLSLSTFRRKFQEIYGTSPGKYIQHQRLEKAAQLLTISNQQVSEICFDCGFGDISNFTKAFSKKYGCSPSKFREKNVE